MSIMTLDRAISRVRINVDNMVENLDNYSVSYLKWIEYYLEYRALKSYIYFNESFSKFSKDLGEALLRADVSYTKGEESSYNDWCESIKEDLGHSKKMEINGK